MLVTTITGINAQEILFGTVTSTEKKTGIDKDIEIAENILLTLLKQEAGVSKFSRVQGSYIKEYGVIFSLPKKQGSRIFNASSGQNYIIDDGTAYTYIIDEDGQIKGESGKKKSNWALRRTDSLNAAYDRNIIEIAKSFLADYGNLINGLKANEKIMITDRSINLNNHLFFPSKSRQKAGLSVEAKVSDLALLESGKLNRKQFIDKISVSKREANKAVSKDLELFSSIFNRLYQADLSDTYYMTGKMYYEHLESFGVIYRMSVYSSVSSNSKDQDGYAMATLGLNNLTKKERDEKVKELYPKFKKQLIEHIIQYGGTINSLKPDEIVMFNVKLTECVGCDIPVNLELSVKAGILKEVKSGTLSISKAMEKFSVTEKGKQ